MGLLDKMAAWGERKQAEQRAWMAEQQARNEAERVGLVAHHAGVRLYEDRIEHGDEQRPLAGVRARVDEHRTGAEWGGIEQKKIWLTVSGPGFEWPVRVPEIVSSRKAREFAAKVNAAATGAGGPSTPVPSDVPAQLRELAEMHEAGALTEAEFAAAKARVLGRSDG